MKRLKLLLLANNLVCRPGLLAEHGLAFWLEDGERWMLPAATTAPRFSRHQDGSMHDIGMPAPCRDALVRFASPTDRPAAGPNEIMPGIFTTGPIPREHAWETVAGFFLDAAGHEVDAIPDDQAMWLDTAAGVVVLLGCAHAGCINTLELIRRQAGGRPFAAIVGGTHLGGADAVRVARTVAALRAFAPATLVPLHCTGAAAGFLRHEFPATCRAWGVGDGTTFDM